MPKTITLKTPEPKVTTLEEFKEYLADSWVDPELHHLFLNAAEHQFPWHMKMLEPYMGYDCIVDIYGDNLWTKGGNAWVSKKGEIIYCSWAAHDTVARVFFGRPEKDFERDYAKITRTTKTPGRGDGIRHQAYKENGTGRS